MEPLREKALLISNMNRLTQRRKGAKVGRKIKVILAFHTLVQQRQKITFNSPTTNYELRITNYELLCLV